MCVIKFNKIIEIVHVMTCGNEKKSCQVVLSITDLLTALLRQDRRAEKAGPFTITPAVLTCPPRVLLAIFNYSVQAAVLSESSGPAVAQFFYFNNSTAVNYCCGTFPDHLINRKYRPMLMCV